MASEGRAVIHGKPKPLPEKPVARANSIGGGRIITPEVKHGSTGNPISQVELICLQLSA